MKVAPCARALKPDRGHAWALECSAEDNRARADLEDLPAVGPIGVWFVFLPCLPRSRARVASRLRPLQATHQQSERRFSLDMFLDRRVRMFNSTSPRPTDTSVISSHGNKHDSSCRGIQHGCLLGSHWRLFACLWRFGRSLGIDGCCGLPLSSSTTVLRCRMILSR